jgi:hypothetical protein
MTFTDEQIDQITKLAGVNYTVRKIAIFLDVDPLQLQREFNDVDSEFRRHYDRGRLLTQAKIDMALLISAEGQSLSAIQQLEKIRTARHFENMRDSLVYGDY